MKAVFPFWPRLSDSRLTRRLGAATSVADCRPHRLQSVCDMQIVSAVDLKKKWQKPQGKTFLMKLDVVHILGGVFKRNANHISTNVSPSGCFSCRANRERRLGRVWWEGRDGTDWARIPAAGKKSRGKRTCTAMSRRDYLQSRASTCRSSRNPECMKFLTPVSLPRQLAGNGCWSLDHMDLIWSPAKHQPQQSGAGGPNLISLEVRSAVNTAASDRVLSREFLLIFAPNYCFSFFLTLFSSIIIFFIFIFFMQNNATAGNSSEAVEAFA